MQENLLPAMHDIASMEELRVRFHEDIQEIDYWEDHMQSIGIQVIFVLTIPSPPIAKAIRVRLIEDERQRKNVHGIRPEKNEPTHRIEGFHVLRNEINVRVRPSRNHAESFFDRQRR